VTEIGCLATSDAAQRKAVVVSWVLTIVLN